MTADEAIAAIGQLVEEGQRDLALSLSPYLTYGEEYDRTVATAVWTACTHPSRADYWLARAVVAAAAVASRRLAASLRRASRAL